MITKNFDRYEISCDYCSTGSEEISTDYKSEAINQIKEDGWRIVKINNEFRHKCPDCTGD